MIPEKESSISIKSKESVLNQYSDITDSCSKRIAALTELIQKLRDEKIQMLQNPPAALNTVSFALLCPTICGYIQHILRYKEVIICIASAHLHNYDVL